MSKKEYYLDEASTAKVDKSVLEAMRPYFLEKYGNPSSLHKKGDKVLKELERARVKFSRKLGCKASEIYFTSGASESNNIVLKGLRKLGNKKILISAIEHPSIKETAEFLKNLGVEVLEIPIDRSGFIDLDFLKKNIDENTCLVSVIHGNNIIGSVQDLKKIGKICELKKVLFHTDATQTLGKLKINVRDFGISMLSASAHKIGGPKGAGLLYVKASITLDPLIHGGGQENGLRSGTENVPGIIGFVKALDLVRKPNNEIKKYFMDKLESIGGKINGLKNSGLGIINVSFPGISGETLVYRLSEKGIYVSAGAACDSRKEKEDYVLKSLGLNKSDIEGSVRISVPVSLSKKDVDYVVKEINKNLKKLRQ